jgi:hypothetical protein
MGRILESAWVPHSLGPSPKGGLSRNPCDSVDIVKNSLIPRAILTVLGLVLTVLGSWRLLDPVAFFENSGLLLGDNVGLLSEARATGGAVAGFGILVLSGAFVRKLSYTSTVAAIVLFLGFGIGRIFGFGTDGIPEAVLVQGAIFEFVFGLIAVFALFKYREES